MFDAAGWYQKARILPSPNFNLRPTPDDISLLVIHCISLPEGEYDNDHVEAFFLNQLDVKQDASFLTLAGLHVSSHFYIKRDGEIIQFVAVKNRAWHAGVSCYQARENCNDFSIGIELQGTDKSAYDARQYQSLIALTKDLIVAYPKLKGNITGHEAIAPKRKTDPGIGFNWPYYLGEIER